MAAQPRHPSLHMTGQGHTARDLRAKAEGVNDEIRSMLDQIEDCARRRGEQHRTTLAGWDIVDMLRAQYVALLAEARRYDALMQNIGA